MAQTGIRHRREWSSHGVPIVYIRIKGRRNMQGAMEDRWMKGEY